MHKKQRLNQSGIAHLLFLFVVIVIVAVGFVGWKVLSKEKKNDNSNNQTQAASSKTAGYIEWQFNGEDTWTPDGEAPDCESPLAIASPIDVSKANSILYPGQVRGGDFKPHGGLGLNDVTGNKVDVLAIRDAYLYQGSRYIEQGEVQYMFDFMDPCGIRYRFDHLATLSAELQKYANQLPEAKPDDSRTTFINEHPLFKKGSIIATEVGFKNTKNAGFDLGVYDLRQRNEASKTDKYKTDQQRIQDKEQSFFAVCWFDLLQGKDKIIVKALPPRGGEKERNSDYCQI